jgi:acetaldehyde dehydrogenase/alcohol dehydrogenase
MAVSQTRSQPHPVEVVDPAQADRLDGFVIRAQAAAKSFRRLDQDAVDAIVWAMVVAGLESAFELAQLAMEETQFGVLEDKVVKNYIATEFLYDYLKDKPSACASRRNLETSPNPSAW